MRHRRRAPGWIWVFVGVDLIVLPWVLVLLSGSGHALAATASWFTVPAGLALIAFGLLTFRVR